MSFLTLILYILLIVVLAVATFVESAKGSSFVMEHIYQSVPFIVLWGALGVLMIFSLWKKTFFQVGPKILLHFSFVVILIGALTSFLTSRKGMMHLRMGEPTFQYVEDETRRVLDLPFTLTLDTFYIDYYPATEAPADYVCIVTSDELRATSGHAEQDSSRFTLHASLTHTISMNNILMHKGFRFYQSSFDEDGRGSWLSVNYDPWGTGITYAGYILCVVAMIGLMAHPKGGFRRLLKKATSDELQVTSSMGQKNIRTKENKGGLKIILCPFVLMSKKKRYLLLVTCSLSLVALFAFAQGTKSLRVVPLEEAESMKRMQVIYHDRVVPLNTLARDFVRKLYGEDSYEGLTPEQVLLGWQSATGDELQAMSNELRATSDGPRAMRELEEKRALVQMLQNGTLIRPLPADGSGEPLSKAKVEAELLYNRIPFTKILFMFNLTMGVVLLVTSSFRQKNIRTKESKGIFRKFLCPYVLMSKGRKYSSLVARSLFLFALLFHLTGYLLRWYIGGRIPLSNGPETMLFLALCIMVLAWVMRRRFAPALAFGFLLSGFALLVAYLGEMNPQITPLMPVLASPWLSLHVSVIMMAYALFAFIMLNGVWALCVPREAERLEVYSRLMLYPAVFLLLAGIFMGAVWANVSWGRYWGWDPKEVWALISVMIYALPMHKLPSSLGRGTKSFHVYMIVAFLSILITYFGVNFFLGGMHSYA